MAVPLGTFPMGMQNVQQTGVLANSTSNGGTGDVLAIATDGLGSVDFALDNGSVAPTGANVVFESTSDGTTWIPTKAYQKGGTGAAGSTSATTAGVYNVTVGGAQQVRVRLTAITAGTFNVTANGTGAPAHVGVKNANATDLNATVTLSATDAQVGVDGTGITQPTGGSGIRGWLSGIYKLLSGTLTVSSASLPLPVGAATAANQATVNTSLTALSATVSTAANQTTANTTLTAISNSLKATLAVATPVGAPLTGQVPIVTTSTAVALGAGALTNGVIVKAALTNAGTIMVGGSGVTNVNTGTGNGYPLTPGEAISVAAANLNQIFINGTAADFVAYAGN
jgi:hypothetical protein